MRRRGVDHPAVAFACCGFLDGNLLMVTEPSKGLWQGSVAITKHRRAVPAAGMLTAHCSPLAARRTLHAARCGRVGGALLQTCEGNMQGLEGLLGDLSGITSRLTGELDGVDNTASEPSLFSPSPSSHAHAHATRHTHTPHAHARVCAAGCTHAPPSWGVGVVKRTEPRNHECTIPSGVRPPSSTLSPVRQREGLGVRVFQRRSAVERGSTARRERGGSPHRG